MGQRMWLRVSRRVDLNLLLSGAVLTGLSCGGGDVTPPPTTGTLEITTSTSGAEQDPDGYTVQVDGASTRAIGAAATLTMSDLTPGNHTVRLGEVAANCIVSGDNPRTVSVTAGETATVGLAVACSATSPTTGIIRVSVTTSGSPADPDGYITKLDGTDPGLSAGTNGSVSFTSIPPGSHTVDLTGVASNCSVTDGPSRTITVAAAATSDVSFVVTCSATTGSIKVTTASTGTPSDGNGYTVKVDVGAEQEIGVNASLVVSNVGPGDHDLTLADLATNCTAEAPNPRTVTVTAGVEASVTFVVTCAPTGATHWSNFPLPEGFGVSALWASSSSDVFVAGLDVQGDRARVVLHYDGMTWRERFRANFPIWDSGNTLIWASGNTVFAAGGAEVWRDDGTGGRVINEPYIDMYKGIWGTSPQDVFVVGDNEHNQGFVEHYDGTSWTELARNGPYGDMFDISGSSPTDVWTLGTYSTTSEFPPELESSESNVYHYDGTTWSVSFATSTGPGGSSDDHTELTGIWANAKNDVFVVGAAGHIYHFNGTAWSRMTSPTSESLKDIWGSSGSNVYAVGDGGILHYNGVRWTVVNAAKGNRVWVAGDDVFVLSEGAILHGTL